ncbi:UNVERIFIED_CONTAM: hypothetical protein GTU68_045659, partial [Idotea baltica]|nr:hypothetical protein [Idotea baltica]
AWSHRYAQEVSWLSLPGPGDTGQVSHERPPVCLRAGGGGDTRLILHEWPGAAFSRKSRTRQVHLGHRQPGPVSITPAQTRISAGRHRFADATKNLAAQFRPDTWKTLVGGSEYDFPPACSNAAENTPSRRPCQCARDLILESAWGPSVKLRALAPVPGG